MTINFSINDISGDNSFIISFLEKRNNFKFIPLEKFYHFNSFQFLVLKKNTTNEDFNFLLKKTKNQNIVFFSHKILKEKFLTSHKVIFFPINVLLFEQQIKTYQKTNTSFFDICLTQDSFLVNTSNHKKIHLTEKEYEIVNFFFKELIVDKKKIHKDILGLQENIDTKSVDAHLSRIRSKLANINSDVIITPSNINFLEIKKI